MSEKEKIPDHILEVFKRFTESFKYYDEIFKQTIQSMEPVKKFKEQMASQLEVIREAIKQAGELPQMELLERHQISPPLIRPPSAIEQAGLASEYAGRLMNQINKFDASLDQEHDVGIRLVSFEKTITFHLTKIGYWNPGLIIFYGHLDNGTPVELIQHVSQISIALLKLKRKDLGKPKGPIGFSPEEPLPDTGEKSE